MEKWVRVSTKLRCPACNHADWCLIAKDGTAAICMRVVSHKVVQLSDGTPGYLHRIGAEPIKVFYDKKEETPAFVNCQKLMAGWSKATKFSWYLKFAEILGVHAGSLIAMGAAWAQEHDAWAFPMMDCRGSVIGIRLRKMDGTKLTVKGTHNGIFVPSSEPQSTMYVVEGPTDAAAGCSIGLWTIGRPSCNGGINYIVGTVKRLGIKRVVIIADNDSDKVDETGDWKRNPGIEGALGLQDHLTVPSCVITTPTKDLREYVRLGGKSDLLTSMVGQSVWNQPERVNV